MMAQQWQDTVHICSTMVGYRTHSTRRTVNVSMEKLQKSCYTESRLRLDVKKGIIDRRLEVLCVQRCLRWRIIIGFNDGTYICSPAISVFVYTEYIDFSNAKWRLELMIGNGSSS